MKHRIGVALPFAALVFMFSGCAPQPAAEAPPAATSTSPTPAAPAAEPTFVDRTWQVASSPQIQPGAHYTFYSDGRLEITSTGNQPLIGAWARTDSGLTMTEEGITYPVDVLELTADRFRIRMHNPGESVEIVFVPMKSE